MNYTEYKHTLQEALQERVGENAKVYLATAEKLNGVTDDVFMIEKKGKDIHLRIYLKELYEESGMGERLEESVDILYCLSEEKPFVSQEDIPEIWRSAKRRIEMRLINKKWNIKMLEDVPYKEYLDFAVIFVVLIAAKDDVQAMLTVDREWMKKWGIGLDDLWEAAQENLKKENFFVKSISSMLEPVADKVPEAEEEVIEWCGNLYVMSNVRRCYGARVLLRKEILRRFAEEHNCNLYLLPSSLHEFLALEDDGICESSGLKKLVCEVNGEPEIIDQEQWLSDSVYYYDREKDEVRSVA